MIIIFIKNIKIIDKKKSCIIKKIKNKLISTFLMADMSLISFYLGFKCNVVAT